MAGKQVQHKTVKPVPAALLPAGRGWAWQGAASLKRGPPFRHDALLMYWLTDRAGGGVWWETFLIFRYADSFSSGFLIRGGLAFADFSAWAQVSLPSVQGCHKHTRGLCPPPP